MDGCARRHEQGAGTLGGLYLGAGIEVELSRRNLSSEVGEWEAFGGGEVGGTEGGSQGDEKMASRAWRDSSSSCRTAPDPGLVHRYPNSICFAEAVFSSKISLSKLYYSPITSNFSKLYYSPITLNFLPHAWSIKCR